MWISPDGNLETRPSIVPIIKLPNGGRITGLFHSKMFNCTFIVSNGTSSEGTPWVPGDNILFKLDTSTQPPIATALGALSGKNEKVSIIEFINPMSETKTDPNIFIASGGILEHYDGVSIKAYPKNTGSIDTPEMDYITSWQERLWGFKGNTIYASGYRDPGDFGPSSGEIQLTTGGQIEIRPNDGTEISGICIFQGNTYVTKAEKGGTKGSFWTITGTSFHPESSDPITVKLINDGLGCVDPFTMLPTLNTVMFCGIDGQVFSQSEVDRYAYPQSVPTNQRVLPAFKGNNEPFVAAFQPRLGYYTVLMRNESSGFAEIWAYHVGTQGWWRWELINASPTFIAPGERDQLLFGDINGVISRMDLSSYGVDGGNDITRRQQYTSGLSFGIIDANSTRDKFFEWLFVDYLPLGDPGQMWVDYREGRGYTYAYTSGVLSDQNQTAKAVGWDFAVSQWDVPHVGWDMGGTVEVANRVNRRTSTLQIALNANTPFRLIGVAITGGVIATKFRSWYRK
jgi:hypothetical protein